MTYVNVNRIELSISQPEIYITKSVIPNPYASKFLVQSDLIENVFVLDDL